MQVEYNINIFMLKNAIFFYAKYIINNIYRTSVGLVRAVGA